MAHVYAPPEGMEPPKYDFNLSWETMRSLEDMYLQELSDWCKANGSGKWAGTQLQFPVADGYAVYMVLRTKPMTLIHVPLGDAYQVPDAHIRGLRVSDIEAQVKWRETWEQLGQENADA